MHTAVVLFGRDLRVHDHPALAAATAAAERVVPLFVLDEAILGSAYNRPNRAHLLAACLADLDRSLRERGGALVVRRGDVVAETVRTAREVHADAVFAHTDVSGYAQRRQARLADEVPAELRLLDGGTTAVPPGAVRPVGEPYGVFTPYHRAWTTALPWRTVCAAPRRIELPPGVATGDLPAGADLCPGPTSPGLAPSGEPAARAAVERWRRDGLARYETARDDLAADATSRLSPWLHFGALSAFELATRLRDRPGGEAYTRQLAWRDFHAQCLAGRPGAVRDDYRPRADRWRDDADAVEAWRAGRTGYPVVDAGMRQLAAEGWMHNRARLITASFLTKTLYVDWRVGAQHFADLLADGDTANNTMNWQWMAGTGADTRPNRVLNPLRQAQRYDPAGDYVRRYVPELAGIPGAAAHRPWELDRPPAGYPAPIVDLDDGRRRFLAARG